MDRQYKKLIDSENGKNYFLVSAQDNSFRAFGVVANFEEAIKKCAYRAKEYIMGDYNAFFNKISIKREVMNELNLNHKIFKQ